MKKLVLGASIVLGAAFGCSTKTVVQDPPGPSPEPSSMPVFAGKSFQAQTPPTPISGGTLLTTIVDGMPLALASDPDEDVIHVVALDDQPRELGRVVLQAGDEPGRLVADAAGRVHVVLRRGGAIATIVPTSTGAWLAQRRSVCSAPRGIDYDAQTDSLWVACATGELMQLASAGGGPTFTTKLQRDLRDVVVDGNTLYITRFRSAQILQFDLAKLALSTGSLLPPVPLNVQSAAAPDVAWRAGKLPGGGLRVLFQVASTAPIDIAQPPGVSSYGGSGNTQVDPGAGGVVSVAVANVGGSGSSKSVGLTSNPVVDMTPNSVGDFETVSIGGVIENGRAEQLRLPGDDGQVSGQPDEFVALARSGTQLVVQRRGAKLTLLVLVSDASLSLQATSVRATVTLQQNASHVDTGFDVFHNPTSGGIACMNCHPEGGDDGHTWTFQTNNGDRVRRTQSLRGGIITSSAPYHWDGDMTDLQVLCDEVFTHRMGGGALVPQTQTPALARFLNSMPRVNVSTSLDQTRVAKGQEIFNSSTALCSSCHQGGQGTLSENRDIGKVDSIGASAPLQVPILLGVADRAPYMHDGCAATLMDRLNNPSCAGSNHGVVQGLTDDDKQNLVEYLESLNLLRGFAAMG